MIEKPAKGVTGFLLYNPSDHGYFFRVYNQADKSKYTDYKLAAEDIEITLVSNFISLYEGENGENKLGYSSKALGK